MNRAKLSTISYLYMFNPEGFEMYIQGDEELEIVESKSDKNTDCFSYAFGVKNAHPSLIHKVNEQVDFNYEPEFGDHIWYFSGITPVHIGFIEEDGRVKSQWGNGPVLKHHIWKVPLSYGSRVKYAQKPNEEVIADLENRLKSYNKNHKVLSKVLPFHLTD